MLVAIALAAILTCTAVQEGWFRHPGLENATSTSPEKGRREPTFKLYGLEPCRRYAIDAASEPIKDVYGPFRS